MSAQASTIALAAPGATQRRGDAEPRPRIAGSAASRLHAHRTRILADVDRGVVAEQFRGDLRTFLELHLVAAEGRAEGAAQRNRERGERIRAVVRLIAEPLLARGLDLETVCDLVAKRTRWKPQVYGLKRQPSARLIRETVQAMPADVVPEPARQRGDDSMRSSNGR